MPSIPTRTKIAPFAQWIERYNDRIGLFGGIDVDLLCPQ